MFKNRKKQTNKKAFKITKLIISLVRKTKSSGQEFEIIKKNKN